MTGVKKREKNNVLTTYVRVAHSDITHFPPVLLTMNATLGAGGRRYAATTTLRRQHTMGLTTKTIVSKVFKMLK